MNSDIAAALQTAKMLEEKGDWKAAENALCVVYELRANQPNPPLLPGLNDIQERIKAHREKAFLSSELADDNIDS